MILPVVFSDSPCELWFGTSNPKSSSMTSWTQKQCNIREGALCSSYVPNLVTVAATVFSLSHELTCMYVVRPVRNMNKSVLSKYELHTYTERRPLPLYAALENDLQFVISSVATERLHWSKPSHVTYQIFLPHLIQYKQLLAKISGNKFC